MPFTKSFSHPFPSSNTNDNGIPFLILVAFSYSGVRVHNYSNTNRIKNRNILNETRENLNLNKGRNREVAILVNSVIKAQRPVSDERKGCQHRHQIIYRFNVTIRNQLCPQIKSIAINSMPYADDSALIHSDSRVAATTRYLSPSSSLKKTKTLELKPSESIFNPNHSPTTE